MKILVMQFSQPSRHSITLWSKYSPKHPVLKHPQFMCRATDNFQNCNYLLDFEINLTK
jgi:hypothetical protein